MDYTSHFNDIIKEGFSNEVALLTVVLYSMNVTKKMKNRHIKAGVFTEELLTKFKEAMWEEDEMLVNEAICIWEVLYDHHLCQTFQGMGGCKYKTIRELMAEKALTKEDNPVK